VSPRNVAVRWVKQDILEGGLTQHRTEMFGSLNAGVKRKEYAHRLHEVGKDFEYRKRGGGGTVQIPSMERRCTAVPPAKKKKNTKKKKKEKKKKKGRKKKEKKKKKKKKKKDKKRKG